MSFFPSVLLFLFYSVLRKLLLLFCSLCTLPDFYHSSPPYSSFAFAPFSWSYSRGRLLFRRGLISTRATFPYRLPRPFIFACFPSPLNQHFLLPCRQKFLLFDNPIPPMQNRSSGRACWKINQVKENVSKNDQLLCMRIVVDRFFK